MVSVQKKSIKTEENTRRLRIEITSKKKVGRIRDCKTEHILTANEGERTTRQ